MPAPEPQLKPSSRVFGHYREEVLATGQEATDIHRELAAARPDAFRPHLVGSLHNLSNRLAGMGRLEEALAAIQETTDIFRELAAGRPDAFRPHRATSLSNLSARLADLGQRKEALATGQEAADIYRELAAAGLMPTATSWNGRWELSSGLSTAKAAATHPRKSMRRDNSPLSRLRPSPFVLRKKAARSAYLLG